MNFEKNISNINSTEEKPKIEDSQDLYNESGSSGLEEIQLKDEVRQYLERYLELKEGDVERVEILKVKDLPKEYQAQRKQFNDERLDGINIIVVPDDLWLKGSQPSESNAENDIVSIKQSYFETKENPDEFAWMVHELAHCQNFLDSASPEAYQKNMEILAFDDLNSEHSYPNNLVEEAVFTKQFQFLKKGGKSREDIVMMISDYYEDEDLPFFEKILDSVYI